MVAAGVTFVALTRCSLQMRRSVFEAALTRHQRRIFSYAYYLLSDRAEAEDVVQEVFMTLWRRGDGVQRVRMEKWLLTVARNACIDRLRHQSVRRRVFSDGPPETEPEGAASRSSDPEVLALSSEEGRRLSAAIAELPESRRSVLILREVQGLGYLDIAEILGLSLSAVKVQLHRARQHLRQKLREGVERAEAS
jgi:RNA polymerase sigma-70 factor (ECF subfamily)